MILSPRLDPDTQSDDEMVATLVADTPYNEGAARYVVEVLRGRATDWGVLERLA